MKALKIVGVLLIAVIVFGVVSFLLLDRNINQLVKMTVESVGSEVLKTQVTLAAADVDIREGRAQLSGLTIANVGGFSEPTVFEMKDIIVDLEIAALIDQIVDLKEVTIDGVKITAEQKGVGTNLQQLLDNLNSSAGTSNSEESTGESSSAATDVLMKIQNFNFTNTSAQLVTEQWGQESLNIPAIQLTNIGGQNGVKPDQLAQEILKPILQQINEAVKDNIEEKAKEAVKEKLGEKEDEIKDKLRDKLTEKLGETGAKDAEGALRSLLKRD